MKTIGLLGGMSWESTVPYYRLINQHIGQRRGGFHSARIVLVSVDFADVEPLVRTSNWVEMEAQLVICAGALARAGADFMAVCSNTTHRVAEAISAAARLPLLHICDVTATAAKAAGLRRVGLLGTRPTMEEPFYRERLEQHGLAVLLPSPAARTEVNRIIFEELCRGVIREESRAALRVILGALVAAGADAVVLGCTELSLIVQAGDCSAPLLDTTELHARAIAEFALAEDAHEEARAPQAIIGAAQR